jgi:hypothetical protein
MLTSRLGAGAPHTKGVTDVQVFRLRFRTDEAAMEIPSLPRASDGPESVRVL